MILKKSELEKSGLERIAADVQAMAADFVSNWPENKYTQNYSIALFGVAWNKGLNKLDFETELPGQHYITICAMLDYIKNSMPEKYLQPKIIMSKIFPHNIFVSQESAEIKNGKDQHKDKQCIIQEAASNEFTIRDLAIALVKEPALRKQLSRIATMQELVNEAANNFLEAYPTFKADPKYNLAGFLREYDVYSNEFSRKGSLEGSYYPCLKLLMKEYRDAWQEKFFEMIDNTVLADRIKGILNEQAEQAYRNGNGISREDKIRFVEKLITYGVVNLAEFLDEVSYDYLCAMFGDTVFPPEDRKILEEIVKEKRNADTKNAESKDHGVPRKKLIAGINYYLGVCRREETKSSYKYDWRHHTSILDEVTKRISKKILDEDVLIRRRLEHAAKQEHFPLFRENQDAAFKKLEEDIVREKNANPLKAELLEAAYNHFRLMYMMLKTTKHVKHAIPVVKKAQKDI